MEVGRERKGNFRVGGGCVSICNTGFHFSCEDEANSPTICADASFAKLQDEQHRTRTSYCVLLSGLIPD